MSSEQVAAVLRQSGMQNQSVAFIVARPVISIASSEVAEANTKHEDNNAHIDDCSGLNINLINLNNLNMNSQCFFIQTSEIMDKNINLKQRLAFEMEKRKQKEDLFIEPTLAATTAATTTQLTSNIILPCFSDHIDECTSQNNELVMPDAQNEPGKPVESPLPYPLPPLPTALTPPFSEQKQQQQQKQEQEQKKEPEPVSSDVSNESCYFINLTKSSSNSFEFTDDLDGSSSNKNEYIVNKLSSQYSFQALIEILDETVCYLISSEEANKNLHESYEQFDEIAEIDAHSLDSLFALNSQTLKKLFQLKMSNLQLKMRKNFALKQFKLKQKWIKLINYAGEIIVSQIDKQPSQSLGINLEGTVSEYRFET